MPSTGLFNIVAMATAKSHAYVEVPTWSKTTFSAGLVSVRLSMVLQKFLPNSLYNQAVRMMMCLQPVALIRSSPCSFVNPYTPVGVPF